MHHTSRGVLIVLLVCATSDLGAALDNQQSQVVVLKDEPCVDYAVADCSTHEGCEVCQLDLPLFKVSFCLNENAADQLPPGIGSRAFNSLT
jgi:hypothetical protein